MKLWILILAMVAGGVSAAAQVPVVNTLSNLVARPVSPSPRTQIALDVLRHSDGIDWGGSRRWVWDATNTLATNRLWNGQVLRASTYLTNNVGRWVHDWDGHPGVFGVVMDGQTDTSVAFQAMVDAQARSRNPAGTNSSATFFDGGGLIGPPIRGPAGRAACVQGIQLYYGSSIWGDHPPADRDYPRDQTAFRLVAPPNATQSVLKLSQYVLDGVTNTSRFVSLVNLVIDGNLANQNSNHLWLHGIEIDGQNIKNNVFEGVSVYDTVGYGIFARSTSLGASTIGNYYGSFYPGGATDLMVYNCRFTGRTQGANSGTPFPPFWMDRFGGKSQFANLFLFGGPRREPGYHNSLRKWTITDYPTSSSLTLDSTNGLYTGMPVMYSSDSTATNATNLGKDNTYYVLFGGSNTVQLVSTTFWFDRTPATFTPGPRTNDVLVLGTTNAPLMLLSGLDNSGLNMFSNVRLEDNWGDLLELVGSSANTFANLTANFAYTNTSRFVRFRQGADNNRFTGGLIGRRTDGLAWPAPVTTIEFDENSEGNSFSGVHVAYATGPNVIDLSTNAPPNRFDGVGTQFFPLAGSAPGIRFEDRDVTGGVVTNLLIYNNRSLYFADDSESDYSNRADWWWDGINNNWHTVGDSQSPGITLSGYSAAPVLALRESGGSRSSPSATGADVILGGLFFGGYDSNDWTSGRASILGKSSAAWTPTSTSTKIDFEITPVGGTNRTSVWTFNADGTATWTDDNHVLTIAGDLNNGLKFNLPSGHSAGAYLSVQVNFVNVFRADGSTNSTNSGLNIMTPWGFKRFAFTNINGAAVAYIPGVTPP